MTSIAQLWDAHKASEAAWAAAISAAWSSSTGYLPTEEERDLVDDARRVAIRARRDLEEGLAQ